MLLSGVELELFGLVVLVDDGLVELVGFVEFMSELLEPVGEVDVLELLLDGEDELEFELEFMSELLLVVDDGELELLEPVWLDCVDGVL